MKNTYLIEQRKRVLLGLIDILIIQWVKEKPLCGQDIINKIKKEFNLAFSSGTIYPILYNLKYKELITSTTINKRKYFHLTSKGKKISNSLLVDYIKTQKSLESFFKK